MRTRPGRSPGPHPHVPTRAVARASCYSLLLASLQGAGRHGRGRRVTLRLDDEDDAAVLLRARLVTLRTANDLARLAVADRHQVLVGHALRDEVGADGLGTTLREPDVVAGRAGRIGEALDRDLRARVVLLGDRGETIERRLILGAN